MNEKKLEKLKIFATEIRCETLKEVKIRGFGHIGGALSIVETLAVLYGGVMKIDAKNPKWKERDYFVCSKGHAGPSIYATLALKGFFDIKELETLNQNGTNLPSHCDMNKTVGIDMTTGSLGQGVSSAIGIALGNRLNKIDNFTYLIVGDGELNEGQCWEGIMMAAHQKLDNLICFVDENKKQLDGFTKDINNPFDFVEKFKAFGWNAVRVNGENLEEIYEAINNAKQNKGKPNVIILDTVKGQGIDFVIKDGGHHMRFSDQNHIDAKKTILKLEEEIKRLKEAQNV